MTESGVSAILAVYNGRRFIGEAIESILGQTRPPREAIVVDDGSTDGTHEVVARYPQVHYHRQANAGQPSALNVGVSKSSSTHVAFLDADDIWMPDKIEIQIEALDADPGLDMVFGLAEQFADPSAPAEVAPSISEARRVLPAQLPSALLITRAAFDRTGGFRGNWKLGNVVDWYARAMEAGLRACTLDRVVYRRRIHDANTGVTQARSQSDYLAVIKAALDRRRNASG